MKKIIYILLSVLVSTFVLKAQGTKKYILFEHFSNASCDPCAQYNPAFETLFRANQEHGHHIVYHVNFPGYDPFYYQNPIEIDNRDAYYEFPGVPSIYINGLTQEWLPDITQTYINLLLLQQGLSPIGITVEEQENEQNEREVNVSVKTHGELPANTSDWVIQVAVVEKSINYSLPPGLNGETAFTNVFRKMLTNIEGESFEGAATIGETVEYTYSYTPEEEWYNENLYIIAFVQNKATREVLNSGASPLSDLPLEYETLEQVNIKYASESETAVFEGHAELSAAIEGKLQFRLTSDAPEDWTASVAVDNIPNDSEIIEIEAEEGKEYTIKASITPGESLEIVEYTLILTSDNPLFSSQRFTFLVNNGVKDLVINSYDEDIENQFVEGLAFAGKEGVLQFNMDYFTENSLAFEGLENLYYNVDLTTFAFLNPTFVGILTEKMDAGLNLLIIGQDVGWHTFTFSSNESRVFYNNYLHANYLSDTVEGVNLTLIPLTEDENFGHLAETPIIAYQDPWWGFSPDEIAPNDDHASPIFRYNNSLGSIAGIKANTGTYKVVYVGIGLGMMGEKSNQNNFMKATYDWFHGITTDIEFDKAISSIGMGQNYPNPSNQFTQIDMTNINRDLILTIMDATGRKVMEQPVSAGSTHVQIPTAHLQNGVYVYQLKSKNTIVSTKKMVVAH